MPGRGRFKNGARSRFNEGDVSSGGEESKLDDIWIGGGV
jgi:hypothetical protein